jgi:hypothetical protein
MSKRLQSILRQLPSERPSPAFRHIRDMANDPAVDVADAVSTIQTAEEALSIWLVRSQNAMLRGRRFIGLNELLRALNQLPPKSTVEQFALTLGLTTGLLFVEVESRTPLGAVISTRTDVDDARSRQNWSFAMTPPETLDETTVPQVSSRRPPRSLDNSHGRETLAVSRSHK